MQPLYYSIYDMIVGNAPRGVPSALFNPHKGMPQRDIPYGYPQSIHNSAITFSPLTHCPLPPGKGPFCLSFESALQCAVSKFLPIGGTTDFNNVSYLTKSHE